MAREQGRIQNFQKGGGGGAPTSAKDASFLWVWGIGPPEMFENFNL